MKNISGIAPLLLSLLLGLSVLTGCQPTAPSAPAAPAATEAAAPETEAPEADGTEAVTFAESLMATEAETLTESLISTEAATEAEVAVSLAIDKDGSYNSVDDVALYIHTYGELPGNYITKKAAQKLGWSGGSLEKFAPGKSIGGSTFGNNEGILPAEDSYHECDIDTLGKSKRGAKRIVYSEDGDVYYTEDHYETFTLLYTAEGPVTEEIVFGGK